MRALITGANGFVGQALAKRLLTRGDFVRCLVRKPDDLSGLEAINLQKYVGDITHPAAVSRAVAGVDVVFHLAGIRRASDRDTFFRVNTEGTRNVCEAMVQQGTKRLVLCSSLAASGASTPSRPKLESDPFEPAEWYGQSKAEAERLAFTYSDRLEVTAIRPARILGPGDRENLVFFKLVKRGFLLKIGHLNRPLSMVDVEDVVDLMLLQAERPEAVGEAFFCADSVTTQLDILQKRVAQTLGVRTKTLYVPEKLLLFLAALADAFSLMTGKHLPLNRKLARQLLAPAWTCSVDKARRILGFSAKRPIDDSIRRSATWYQAHGWLK